MAKTYSYQNYILSNTSLSEVIALKKLICKATCVTELMIY